MTSNLEKSQFRSLVNSPQFDSIKNLAQALTNKILNEPVGRSSEWEFVRDLLIKQGQVEGIQRLLQELINQSNQ